jgi:hypothetical protein
VDLGKVDAIAGDVIRRMDPSDRASLEGVLRLGAGALGNGKLPAALGMDTGRPIVASLAIAGNGKAVVEHLRALAGQPPSPGLATEVIAPFKEGVAAGSRAGLWARVIVPSTDAGVTVGAVATLLTGLEWKSAPPPDGFDELYVERRDRAVAGLSRLPGAAVIDVAIPAVATEVEGAAATAGRDLLSAIRARPPGGPHDEPLAPAGMIMRAQWSPAALAEAGFLSGVASTARALNLKESGTGIDDAQRGRLAAAGLREAAQSFALAGDARGAFFDRIEAWVEGGVGTIAGAVAASPGPAAKLQEAAWSKAAAIVLPGAFASLDVSVPWLKSWTIIGSDPLESDDFERTLHDAGWPGYWVALPQFLAASTWGPMSRYSGRSGWARRLERMMVVSLAEHSSDAHVGLLPAGTKPAEAECILVEPPAPCSGDKKLRTGAAVSIDGRTFKLVQVKGRWAIVVGRDKAAVDEIKPELAASSAPVRFELPGGPLLAKELKRLPPSVLAERYVAEASVEGGRAVLRAHPVPLTASAAPASRLPAGSPRLAPKK